MTAAALLSGEPLLLDAAMGTELEHRGVDVSAPLWSARALLHAPGLVRDIHRENAMAGAQILTTATFRTHSRNLEAAGLAPEEAASESSRLAVLAVRLAREGASEGVPGLGVLVAGSMAPLQDCWRPDLVPPAAALEREHAEQAARLASAGCDLLLVETMNCLLEALAAAGAAARTGLPFAVAFTTDGRGNLLSGTRLADATKVLADLPHPPAAIGVNCVPACRLLRDMERMAAAVPGFPLVAYGNTGAPQGDPDAFPSGTLCAEEYARMALGWIDAGARLVGACCGTDASFTAALSAATQGK